MRCKYISTSRITPCLGGDGARLLPAEQVLEEFRARHGRAGLNLDRRAGRRGERRHGAGQPVAAMETRRDAREG